MPFDAKTNFARASVAAAPSPATSGTSLTVDTAALLPAVPFNATIFPTGEVPLASNAEIVTVTAIVGTVLTIVRTQEGTTARTIVVGDQFVAGLTAKSLTDIENAIPSTAGLISAVKVSAGASSANLSALTFSNSNGVSFGLSAGTITGSAETNYQAPGAYLTTAALSQDSSKYAGTGTSATNASLTLNSDGLAISVGAGGHNVTLAGNTAGVLAQISTGTLTLAGGNNITVSQVGNAITISGPNVGGAQTGISGIVVSDTTYTSGTVSFSGNNITIASSVDGATQYIKLSGVAAQTNQSAIKAFGVSDTGQTAGNTGLSTGIDWVLAGSGSITLSQSTAVGGPNTVWVQHPAWITTQSGQAFSADALSAFQTLVFQDSNGVSFSNNAGSLRVTHGLQFTSATSAITSAALHTSASRVFNVVAATDNTGGGTASLSSDVSFSAANGLTFYTSAGNAIVGSHNAITTARRSTDAIGLNTAQSNVTWTVNSSGLSLDARGYAGTVTGATGASLTVNTSGVSINLPAYLTTADLSANSSKYVQEWALTGNTAGTTSSAQGTRLYFSGGNSITISGSSNSLVFSVGNYLTTARASTDAIGLNTAKTNVTWTVNSSGLSIDAGGYAGTVTGATGASLTVNSSGVSVNLPAYLTTADLSANSSKYVQEWALTGNTAGTTSSAQGTRLYFSGGNSITISGSSNSLVFSVGNYLTTARASTDAIGLNTAKTNVTWTANSSGLSLDAGGYAGTVTGATGASLTVNSSGVSVNLPAYLTTADLSANSSKYAQEWALTGNTAGTTSSAQGTRWYFSGGNSITISGNSNSLVFSVGDYITTARRSTDAIGLNTAQTNVTWTVNSSGLSFNAGGYAGTTTGATNATVTLNTAGIAISVAAPGAAAEANWVTLQGNVVGSSSASGSTIVWSGGNGVTLSGTNNSIIGIAVSTYDTVGTATTYYSVASANSVGTVTRWAAEDHRHAGVGGIGISTSGNTAGTTGSVLGTYWLQGGNNLTVSQITSNNGSHTLVLSAGGATASYYANINDYGGLATGASAITQTTGASLFIQPFEVACPISAGFVRLLASFNDSGVGTAGTTSNAQTYSCQRFTTVGMVIYTQGVGASSRSIQSLTSTSAGITGITAYGGGANGSRYTITLSKIYPVSGAALQTYTTSYAVSSASIVVSSESNTLFTGPRYLDISWAGSLPQGNYWLGIGQSTSSSSNSSHISFVGTIGMAISLNGVSQTALSFGVLGAATSASDHQVFPGLGVWTTNANIFSKDSIALSQVSQVVSNIQLPFQIIRSA